ncbi:hypothetical protein [Kribbella sp. NPDC051620]|uniref:hypothetical protein n=1 Tax=Kribbella sp. NPDC051620 TaxID=3364120 RepID=UPI00379A19C2
MVPEIPDRTDSPDESAYRAQLKPFWAEITAALAGGMAALPPARSRTQLAVEENLTPQPMTELLVPGKYLLELEQPARPALSAHPARQVPTGRLAAVALGGLAGITLLAAAVAAVRLSPEQILEELTKLGIILVPLALAGLLHRQQTDQDTAQVRPT